MKKAIVVGTGFAGCMYAMMLRDAGWQVTVIERSPITGGGVRTFFHGGHPFTYGPRHFLSPYPEAYEFLSKYAPMRDLRKLNYAYVERDQQFYTYPIHADDIPRMPEADRIQGELDALPEETQANNFEEFWTGRIGATLYDKFVTHYNKKAWLLDHNLEMDHGFEQTVKGKTINSGDRHEHQGWFNCYPIAPDGYNSFFDIALEGCEVRLGTEIEVFDVDNCAVHIKGTGETISADLMISSTSPDLLLDYQFGELRYVGREFHKIVLPLESVFPEDVYFLYYPNENEEHTRVVEYKKFTQHKSPHSLVVLEVPSMKNKLYPMLIKTEVERAQKYFDALPDNVYSVGRQGEYRYIDVDDIIMAGLEFRKQL
jgi:UDP-galactopyranose mutase